MATLEEVRQLRRESRGPLSVAAGLAYDIDNFSIDDLARKGVARLSLPSLAIIAATHGVQRVLREVASSVDLARLVATLTPPGELEPKSCS